VTGFNLFQKELKAFEADKGGEQFIMVDDHHQQL
jgi:hypothetical protein